MTDYEYKIKECKITRLANLLNSEEGAGWEPLTMWPSSLSPETIHVVLRRRKLPQSPSYNR